jgi:hypothetical protein
LSTIIKKIDWKLLFSRILRKKIVSWCRPTTPALDETTFDFDRADRVGLHYFMHYLILRINIIRKEMSS